MLFKILILWSILSLSYAWDSDDFEIFDLYEEVNGTFYELLGVSQDATVAEIKRAYRKRSKELHPDKNKAENAELMFRQLVAVYEVLKDTNKRERYENVLRDGLPDWRQPMYYYRKYRKMGTLEISILVSLIATIGHYLTWWVAYLEKKFIMEERLAPENKKREKKRAKGEKIDDLDVDEVLEQELGYRKPGRWDFLPFVLVRVTRRFITSIPEFIRDVREKRKREEEEKKREEEEAKEAAEKAAQPKPKKLKVPKVIRDAAEFADEDGWVIPGMPQNEADSEDKAKKQTKKSEWTDDDFSALAKAMAKYPGGTPGRWQRIAHELGRSPSDITKKVKEMKENLASHLPSQTGDGNGTATLITRKLDINLSDTMITKAIGNELDKTTLVTDNQYQSQYDIPDDLDEGCAYEEEPEEDYTRSRKKKKVKTRPVEEKNEDEQETDTEKQPENGSNEIKDSSENKENNQPIAEEETKTKKKSNETTSSAPTATTTEQDFWTQIQQRCLEQAIQQFPKSTTDRWTCISRAVPGKTKEQCIGRYKMIAEQVLQRKTKQSKGS